MDRVQGLVAVFNGAIKYVPMLADHPEWSDAECLAFARKWHVVAIANLKRDPAKWNDGIPYCRNQPTVDNLKEAGR